MAPGPADLPGPPLPGLDLPAVLSWSARGAPGLLGPGTTARLLTGGRSNLSYLLDGGGRRVVLRRPPLGHVLATAHDMSREYRMMGALAGTAVPVPEALAYCPDPGVTGAPFCLLEHVAGRVIRGEDDLLDIDAAGRTSVAHAMADVLADLHEVDLDTVGLAGFGRPDGFAERQLDRWHAQLRASRSRELPTVERLHERLAATLPAGAGRSVVHGDYRLDNLIVAGPGEGDALHVRAVLDWEMATVGDPLADLGLLLAYWDVLGGLDDAVVDVAGARHGFPDGATLADRYARRRAVDLTPLPWYVAAGLFKLTAILEGIHYRYRLGRTVGTGFDRIGALVPPLAEAGLEVLAAAGRRG